MVAYFCPKSRMREQNAKRNEHEKDFDATGSPYFPAKYGLSGTHHCETDWNAFCVLNLTAKFALRR